MTSEDTPNSISFPVEVLLAGKTFGRFHIDVGFDELPSGKPEILDTSDLFPFAGIASARVLAVPKAQQFAEKFHAYTHVWNDRENTRVKDLVDMVMLIERGSLDHNEVQLSIKQIFAHRNTHGYPKLITPPPVSWENEFRAMAKQVELAASNITEAFDVLLKFIAKLGTIDK